MKPETIQVEVIYSNGIIDQSQMISLFYDRLQRYISNLECERNQIAEKVDELFQENVGATIRRSTIASMVCNKMNIPLNDHIVMGKRIISYIKKNVGTKFFIVKGPKGGVKCTQ